MQLTVICWAISIVILTGGAWLVCPDKQCILTDFDRVGLELAYSMQSEQLTLLMQLLTWLGSLKLLLPLTILGAWVLYRRHRRRGAAFFMLALLGSAALGQIFKLYVARPRPDLFPAVLPVPEDWSYPSAHAMQVTAAALALLLIAWRRHSSALAVPLGSIVLLVVSSRVYLQLHYPSDVLAGALAAGFWVIGLHAWFWRPAAPGED